MSNKVFTDFISNSLELMRGIKVVLLKLQQSPDDAVIASMLPCATQTIKKLDNFRGCKHVAAFLCVFEGVLCRVRDAELRADEDLLALLLTCCDHVTEMVNHLVSGDAEQISEVFTEHLEKSIMLTSKLRTYYGSTQDFEKAMTLRQTERRHLPDRRWGSD